MRHCKGCSHPTICNTHGCAGEEARANKARQAQTKSHSETMSTLHDALLALRMANALAPSLSQQQKAANDKADEALKLLAAKEA